MTQYTFEVLWIYYLLEEVGLNPISPTKLWCDNQAVLHIDSNLVYYKTTKHIEIDSLHPEKDSRKLYIYWLCEDSRTTW